MTHLRRLVTKRVTHFREAGHEKAVTHCRDAGDEKTVTHSREDVTRRQ